MYTLTRADIRRWSFTCRIRYFHEKTVQLHPQWLNFDYTVYVNRLNGLNGLNREYSDNSEDALANQMLMLYLSKYEEACHKSRVPRISCCKINLL